MSWLKLFLFVACVQVCFGLLENCKSHDTDNNDYLECTSGLESVTGRIAAFADFENSRAASAVIVNGLDIDIYLYDTNLGKYKHNPGSSFTASQGTEILDVIVGDFTFSGTLSMILLLKNTIETKTVTTMEMWDMYSYKYLNFSKSDISFDHAYGRPTIVNYGGNSRFDLFGERADVDGNERQTGFWVNSNQFEFSALCNDCDEDVLPLAATGRHAFVDLTGDCLADLFVVREGDCTGTSGKCPFFQLWQNTGSRFTHNFTVEMPKGTQSPSFVDVDSDGTIDAVFANTETNKLHTIFNTQMPMCGLSIIETQCRDDLCSKTWFKMNFTHPDRTFDLPSDLEFYAKPNHPVILQLGDLTLDRTPDLSVVLKNTTSLDTFVTVFEIRNGIEYHLVDSYTSLRTVDNAVAVKFYDFNYDARLAPLIETESGGIRVFAPWVDAAPLFMRVSVLDGVRYNHIGESRFPHGKPYGAFSPGVSIKFTYTDLFGMKRVVQGMQMIQSTFGVSPLPHTIFGLGQEGNYIDELVIGVPSSSQNYVGAWNTIVPKGRVYIFPYPWNNPTFWFLELFVTPSSNWVFILVVTLICLAVLGIIIAFLKYKELMEDKAERKREAAVFAF
ncbi:hypothetical protein PCE1_004987 [Barthelona sp. PCE]